MKTFKKHFRNYCCEPVLVNELTKILIDCFFEEGKSFRKEAENFLRPPKGMTYEIVSVLDDLLYLVEEIIVSPAFRINASQAFFENAVLYYELACGYREGTLAAIFGGVENLRRICYDLAQKIIADPRAEGWK